MGASVSNIVGLLSKDIVQVILFSSLLAFPLAYFLVDEWLADFAYRVNLTWWVFAVASLIILGIGFLTVAFQSANAAIRIPANNLKSD